LFTPDAVAANPPAVYYVHADHLNTPRLVVDTAGQKRWRWLAEPFGTTVPEDNPAGLGAFVQNLRFPGQYADQESGLSYNYFRDYDASIGRYVQSDPIGLAGGINTYSYVYGNPLTYVDPDGLDAMVLSPLVAPSIPSLTSLCLSNPVACSGVGGVAAGTLLYPRIERPLGDFIDRCVAAASDTPTPQECDAEWLRGRNVCFEWMNELGRPNISDRRRRQLLFLTGGNMGICVSGQVSQACGGTKVEQPPKPRRKRYL
jgi:RHS repeat-associated protein